jgi:hypothetical protein
LLMGGIRMRSRLVSMSKGWESLLFLDTIGARDKSCWLLE